MEKLLQKFIASGENEYKSMKLGLGRIRAVLDYLGNPEKSFSSVLIAGTNGKGSVGRILESILLEGIYRAALYTSPHLSEFNERIRIGGEEILSEDLEEILQEFLEKNILDEEGNFWTPQKERLTWFEKGTVLAFEAFRRKRVELALVEVGMGARFDATNVVDPLVSVITSISKDHSEYLGHSLFEIAMEKAGVFRKGRPVVIGFMPEEVRNFLVKASRLEGAIPVVPFLPAGSTEKFSYGEFLNLSLGLAGDHQLKNAATALEVSRALQEDGFSISKAAIREGLKKVRHPGRLEYFEGRPRVLLDGAHNEESLGALLDYLEKNHKNQTLRIIFGMMEEKEFIRGLEIIKKLHPQFYFTEINSPRSVILSNWKELASLNKIEGKFFKNSLEALQAARENSQDDDLIIVTGSLYLVGEIRKIINPPDVNAASPGALVNPTNR